jgi:hypothetical protein
MLRRDKNPDPEQFGHTKNEHRIWIELFRVQDTKSFISMMKNMVVVGMTIISIEAAAREDSPFSPYTLPPIVQYYC